MGIENLDLGLMLTLVGITVVFSALAILAMLISLFSKVFALKKTPAVSNAEKNSIANNPVNTPNSSGTNINLKTQDEELIPVLTAAILAYMKQSPDFKIRVKSFRRVQDNSPAWNVAGKREQLDAKLQAGF